MPHPGYFYSDESQRERLRALLQGKLSPEQGEGGDLLSEGVDMLPPDDGLTQTRRMDDGSLVVSSPEEGVQHFAAGKTGKPGPVDPASFGEDFKYEDSQAAEKDLVDRALGDTQKWVGGGGWEFELYDAEGDSPYIMVTNSTSGTTKRVKPGDRNADGVDIFEAIMDEKAYLEANPEVAKRVAGQKPPSRPPKAVTRPGDSEGEPLPQGVEPAPSEAAEPLGPPEADDTRTFHWQPPGDNPPRSITFPVTDEAGMAWGEKMSTAFPVKTETESAPAKRPPAEVPATEVSRPLVFEPMEVRGSRPQTQTRAASDGTRAASSPGPEADLAESPAAMRALRAYVLDNGGTEMDARQAEKLAAVYGLNTPRVEAFLEQFAPADEGAL